jgi:hypothetical protein
MAGPDPAMHVLTLAKMDVDARDGRLVPLGFGLLLQLQDVGS